MKKRWVILIALLSIAIGFMGGAFVGFRCWQDFDQAFEQTALETKLMVDAKMRLAVLVDLKGSKPEKAIGFLETLLDGDIIGIDAMLDTSSNKAELLRTLERIAAYRSHNPYRSSNADVAAAVEEVLRHAVQSNNTVERDAPQAARPSP